MTEPSSDSVLALIRRDRLRFAIRCYAESRRHRRWCWRSRPPWPDDPRAAAQRSAEEDVRRDRAELMAALEKLEEPE